MLVSLVLTLIIENCICFGKMLLLIHILYVGRDAEIFRIKLIEQITLPTVKKLNPGWLDFCMIICENVIRTIHTGGETSCRDWNRVIGP